ncbi:hypothetical protein [Nocardia sp. NPDC051570]|uniref:hypothetical protein n=1 Tax=Nocardia sp. NPDC051570 TaxID=3364324 RepID=UPI003791E38D
MTGAGCGADGTGAVVGGTDGAGVAVDGSDGGTGAPVDGADGVVVVGAGVTGSWGVVGGEVVTEGVGVTEGEPGSAWAMVPVARTVSIAAMVTALAARICRRRACRINWYMRATVFLDCVDVCRQTRITCRFA